MDQLNNKQKTIVLLIIILLLLNKINIKKNGMNQEGGDDYLTTQQRNANERQNKSDQRKLFEELRAMPGWNPLNWGWFAFIPFVMVCYLIFAYILSGHNDDDGDVMHVLDDVRTVNTNVGEDEMSILNFLSSSRSPSPSSSPSPSPIKLD